jgi:hypothetical protein
VRAFVNADDAVVGKGYAKPGVAACFYDILFKKLLALAHRQALDAPFDNSVARDAGYCSDGLGSISTLPEQERCRKKHKQACCKNFCCFHE